MPRPHPRRWFALAAIVLGILVIGLDVTILNVALPTLATDLNASNSQLQWIVDAYIVTLAALLLPAGLLGDRLGRRRMLLIGMLIFAAASALAAIADSVGTLVTARALMGVGAAIVMPLSLSIIPSLFPAEERSKAIAVITGGLALGLPLGPLLGGWLLQNYWWGSIFLINLPVALAAAVAGAVLIPESRDRDAPQLQPLATAMAVLGLGALVFGIIEAPEQGWLTARTMVPIALGLGLLALFVWGQSRDGRRPDRRQMVHLELFADRTFLWGSVAAMSSSLLMMGALFLIPQYLQVVAGHSTLGTGIRLLPMVAGLMIAGVVSEKLSYRLGHRLTISGGMGLMATGFALAIGVGPETGYGSVALWLTIIGLGMGLSLVPATDAVLGSLPVHRAGVGAALMQTLRQTGGALGIAVMGSAVNAVYLRQLELPEVGSVLTQAAESSVAGADAAAITSGNSAIAQTAYGAFTEAMGTVFLGGAIFAVITLLAVARFFPTSVQTPTHSAESNHDQAGTARTQKS